MLRLELTRILRAVLTGFPPHFRAIMADAAAEMATAADTAAAPGSEAAAATPAWVEELTAHQRLHRERGLSKMLEELSELAERGGGGRRRMGSNA